MSSSSKIVRLLWVACHSVTSCLQGKNGMERTDRRLRKKWEAVVCTEATPRPAARLSTDLLLGDPLASDTVIKSDTPRRPQRGLEFISSPVRAKIVALWLCCHPEIQPQRCLLYCSSNSPFSLIPPCTDTDGTRLSLMKPWQVTKKKAANRATRLHEDRLQTKQKTGENPVTPSIHPYAPRHSSAGGKSQRGLGRQGKRTTHERL